MLRDDVGLKRSMQFLAGSSDDVKGLWPVGTQQCWGLSDYQDLVYLVGQTCLKCACGLELVH